MDTLINLLALIDLFLAVFLIVLHAERMDRRHLAAIEAEEERNALIKGKRPK